MSQSLRLSRLTQQVRGEWPTVIQNEGPCPLETANQLSLKQFLARIGMIELGPQLWRRQESRISQSC